MAVASKPGDVPVRSSITQAASAASGMSSSGGTDTPPIVTNVSQEIKRIESTSRYELICFFQLDKRRKLDLSLPY